MKKRILSGILTVCMLIGMVLVMPTAVGAETEGDYVYTVIAGEATITGSLSDPSGNIVIPNTLGGYPVTAIGNGSFYDCDDINSVIIPGSVTSIGDEAFYNCDNLNRLTMPDGVTNIGTNAFSYSGYYNEFSNWKDGVLFNGDYLIKAESYIQGAYVIPENVRVIADSAFYDCKNLTSVTIGDSVTNIGDDAFYRCENIESVTIGDSVTNIGSGVFYDCISLTSVTIGDNVTTIGQNAFYNTRISSDYLYVQDDVLCIGDYLIAAQSSVTNPYQVPENIRVIADGAFYNCNSLESVTIGDNVTNIGKDAFYNSSVFNNYNNRQNGMLCIGGFIIDVDGSYYGTYEITDNIKVIGDNSFQNNQSITSVIIGDSVTAIGDNVFDRCEFLESVTIGDNVTNIGKNAFYGTPFYRNNSNWQDGVLCIDDYFIKAKSEISGKYVIPDNIKVIGDNAFLNCDELTSVTIGDNVTAIGDNAFFDCDGLTSVIIGDNVTAIGNDAFVECSALTTVLYRGTQLQWQAIDILPANNNKMTNDLNIVYEYDDAPARIKTVSCVYDNNSGKLSAKVTFDYLFEAGDLVLAIYDNGRLIDVKTKAHTLENNSESFEFDADNNYLNYTVKAFYWDGTDMLMPLANSVGADITELIH